MVRLCQCICIGFDLCIKGTQILAGRISIFNIVLRASWFIIVEKRFARYQLVGSRCIRSLVGCTCSERTCTKSQAPDVFAVFLSLFFGCLSGLLVKNIFTAGSILRINRIYCNVVPNIAGIFCCILLQLFHNDDIMVILAISDFDEAVVGSLRIRVLGYGFRNLRIVIGRAISIGLTLRQLFPIDGIAGGITCIMTKSNGVCFIGRGLIADSCTVLRRHDGLPTGS